MHASELMTTDVASVLPEATRQEIARLLVARGISAVPVVDSNGTPLGMVSEGDLIRRGEPERQQRRNWWLEMLAEGETLSEDYVRQLGGREATARDLMSAPLVMVRGRHRLHGDRDPSHRAPDQTRAGGPRRAAGRHRQPSGPAAGDRAGSATARIRVLTKDLIDHHIADESWQRLLHQVREAAEHGVHDLICSSLHGAWQP